MSSIYSDPFFARGTTLLNGETIEIDPNTTYPVAGGEIVGQVKAFQDVNPYSKKERFSNRLVYCVAARYLGTTVSDASTIAGTMYTFDDANPLSTFTSKSVAADLTANKAVGVLDEYLKGALRQNDIVWLVVKGPTSVQKASAASVAANTSVEVSTAGQVIPNSTGVNVGNSLAGAAVTGAQGTLLRINKTSNQI